MSEWENKKAQNIQHVCSHNERLVMVTQIIIDCWTFSYYGLVYTGN